MEKPHKLTVTPQTMNHIPVYHHLLSLHFSWENYQYKIGMRHIKSVCLKERNRIVRSKNTKWFIKQKVTSHVMSAMIMLLSWWQLCHKPLSFLARSWIVSFVFSYIDLHPLLIFTTHLLIYRWSSVHQPAAAGGFQSQTRET